MVPSFSTTEKRAISKLLLEIMYADEVLKDNEIGYMTQLESVLSISKVDIVASQVFSYDDAITIIRNMKEINKKAFLYMMHQMAKCDGHVDGREAVLVTEIEFDAGLENIRI